MISPVLKIAEGIKVKNRNKTNIKVGYIVKANVVELKKITREGRIRKIRKWFLGCVQAVVGNNNFLVQL